MLDSAAGIHLWNTPDALCKALLAASWVFCALAGASAGDVSVPTSTPRHILQLREQAADRSGARALAENAAFRGNTQAHALCAWSIDVFSVDRVSMEARVNGLPMRLFLDTSSPGWTIFSEPARRLGIKIAKPIPKITPPAGRTPFGLTEECTLEIAGKTLRTAFLVVNSIEEGDGLSGGIAGSDGLCGWGAVSDNIFNINITSGELHTLEKVPEEAASWLKLGLNTNSDYLVLEIPGEGTNRLAVGIDTGSFMGASLGPELWGQWRTAHPDQPLTLNPHRTMGSHNQAEEEGWAEQLSFGPLRLKGVPVSHGDPADMPGRIAMLGLAALKRLDLIVDGKHGVAYVRPKEGPPPPYRHNRLGAIFPPRNSSSDDLVARVTEPSPAYEAGIRTGDVLLKLGDVQATGWRTNISVLALAMLWSRPAGTQFDLTLRRGDQTFTTKVVLREILPPEPLDSPLEPEESVKRVAEHCLGLLPDHFERAVSSEDGCHFACVVSWADQQAVFVDGEEGPIQDEICQGSPNFSPDGRHIAYIARNGTKFLMRVDSQSGPEYDGIGKGCPIFSADSKRVAYVAVEQGLAMVVVDGRSGNGFQNIAADSLLFSPEGGHVAYVAKTGSGAAVVLDGRVGPTYDGCVNLVFSRDGRLAYAAGKRGKLFVVVDGNKGMDYDGIGRNSLIFSPDGKHVIYAAQSGTKWFMVLDGEPGRKHDSIGDGPYFSPDSHHFAYVAETSGKHQVVMDGQPGPEFDNVGGPNLVFSPDGKHLAYRAMRNGKVHFVLDNQPGPPYDGISRGRTIFSPDGLRCTYLAQRGKKQLVVLDGQPQPEYDGILGDTPLFSADSRHLVYGAKKDGGACVVVDGKEGALYDGISQFGSAVAADGTPRAYLARRMDKWLVVTDGRPGPEYDSVTANSPIVSADSKHVAYIARRNGRELVVLDGRPGPHYDSIIKNGPTFRADGGLEYLAVRDSALFRVRHMQQPTGPASNHDP